MSKYPNPCDKCDRVHCSNYRTCPEYLKYFRTIWKQIHGYPARHYRNCKKTKSEKFTYEHPDIIRQYLEKGPCEHCQSEQICETPCGAYWNWWDARMEWLKRRWGVCRKAVEIIPVTSARTGTLPAPTTAGSLISSRGRKNRNGSGKQEENTTKPPVTRWIRYGRVGGQGNAKRTICLHRVSGIL